MQSNNNLPEGLNKLPVKAQDMYKQAYKQSAPRVGKEMASRVAWTAVKKRFQKVDGKWVGKGMGFELFTFTMENKGNAFIKKSKDGEFYLEAVLSDTDVDSEGYKFTEATLKSYAEQINKHGINGFVTHEDWKDFTIANSHLTESQFVAKARKERKGILKAVKAIYQKGKLWIKALIDKRYVKQVEKFDKVSIEALVPGEYRVGNEYRGGHVLGFALDNNAINPRAEARIV